MIFALSVDPNETANKTKFNIENIQEYESAQKDGKIISMRIDDGSIHDGLVILRLSKKGTQQLIHALIAALIQEKEL